jgi:hypothetical protein
VVLPFLFDLHNYDGSPIAGVLNMNDTVFFFGAVGLLLGLVALFRRKEAFRWWASLAVLLNVGAWVTTILMNAHAYPPPGLDY